MSPTPKRQPMVNCPHCGAQNDPARGSKLCVSCNLPLDGTATLQSFVFPVTRAAVRVADLDGEPWFVAVDVGAVLEYANSRKAINDHVPARHQKGNESFPLSDLGLHPQTKLISEAGLYRLVMRSDAPLAEPFQDWVTDEVLPAIRRTGSYSAVPAPRLPDLASPEGVLALAKQFVETAEALVIADAKVKELEPKALAHDRFLTADKGDRLVREVAKLLGWREKDLRAFLLEEGLIFRKPALCGTQYYDVYARHADHFKPVETVVEHTWGACAHYTLYVRPSGVDLIQRRIERQRDAIQKSIGGT